MGFSHGTAWIKMGLTNFDTPDLSELMQPPIKIAVAYCTSHSCCTTWEFNESGKRSIRWTASKKQMALNIKRVECPACGYALLWKRK